eukprot:TRINITY_DN197_c0_g1_i1.p1 TRINITY_DN197_c0_g1~~TRINITY_DN197_c0_g1_i1.p1  ORF type:complete len:1299 (+),score=219.01 TRINITY_DN197_c0_g1_i1:142-3897(+)
MVRSQVLLMVGLPLWTALSPARLKNELLAQPTLQGHWENMLNRAANSSRKAKKRKSESAAGLPFQRKAIPDLLDEFLGEVATVVPAKDADVAMADGEVAKGNGVAGKEGGESIDPARVLYCERFLELLIDLLSQLPTRRFVLAVVLDRAVSVKCLLVPLYSHPLGALFRQLVDLLRYYEGFEIDAHTGRQLSDDDMLRQHCDRLLGLQRRALKHHEENLRPLALTHLAALENRLALRKHLSSLPQEELKELLTHTLHLVSPKDPWVARPEFLLELALCSFERRRSQRQAVNELPLYPIEKVMWNESLVPSTNYTGEGCLALPKLNLQFLTLHDYLLRNFNLFRLESTYEIRSDVEEAVERLQAGPPLEEDGPVQFRGWARMACVLTSFKISEVRPPLLGEIKPAAVLADVQLSIGKFPGNIRSEWDELKEHDVCFLLTLVPPPALTAVEKAKLSVPERLGIQYIRGCEVVEVRDEGGVLMNDMTGRIKREEWKPPVGDKRTILVVLDSAQYQIDTDAGEVEAAHSSVNVIVRRKPKENNFKAILESIRDLMNEQDSVPPWLHDIFLGYDNPAAAHWRKLPRENQLACIDFKDTFLDADHLRSSFPKQEVRFVLPDKSEDPSPRPPFRVTLPAETTAEVVAEVVAEAYTPPDPGPYPADEPKQNTVRFTPVQVEAIIAGVQPGLAMVVGPPGTGKTDTAVQILHVLYHNFPEQRTLLITHSNQALNQLFQKIMQRDVPARYLLRLGMGEQELETEEDFSRQGRVNSMLARRLELLTNVERLAVTLGQTPEAAQDAAATCETAAHFWLLRVYARWEEFIVACEGRQTDEPAIVRDKFPFTEYFKDAPRFNLGGKVYADDMRVAQGCFRHLTRMFQELEECRAFELLRTTADRSNYLMTKQAKIVAMTCTHAALKRKDFIDLRFKYDSVVVEESAQILEIETFIPLVLQREADGKARLKRVVLIGDHQQLPPVVKNPAFQKYSHLDQSLFTRFVRLGTPYTELNAQGRARPSIAKLYSWRYRDLGDLPHVQKERVYQLANAGFAHTFQLVNVEDWQGKGEMEPNPWFYQNLGEAEYLVSCYQYMRLLGYPADKIAILTTYNGQKHLIRDVVKRRCAGHPLFGEPSKITTVDRYQGQQNDYILLSLVRTRTVGHLRDVRRLVVAMSRARLGLYVFCRRGLFEQCFELQPTFQQLLQKPDRLSLVLGEEATPTLREERAAVGKVQLVGGINEMAQVVGRLYERKQQMQTQGQQQRR